MAQCGWIVAGGIVALVVSTSATAQQASTRPGVANAAAWTALQERRYGVAYGLFDTATTSTPDDASLQFGAGVAELMRGRNTEARHRFEAALALDPGLTDASILLGQALYRNGDVVRAADAYGAALGRAPAHPDLLEPLGRWQHEMAVDRTLLALEGAHFVVRFHPADRGLAADALTVAEAAYARLAKALSAHPHRRVGVVLYTPEEFASVTHLPDWAAGLYDGRIKVPLGGRPGVSTDDLARVLDHEIVHAIVAATAGPTVPAWLNEGLATALEPGGIDWAESFAAAPAANTFSGLTRGFRGLLPPEARLAYAQSTRAVRHLLDRVGTNGMGALLKAIGEGRPFADAFRDTMGETFDSFGAPGASH